MNREGYRETLCCSRKQDSARLWLIGLWSVGVARYKIGLDFKEGQSIAGLAQTCADSHYVR